MKTTEGLIPCINSQKHETYSESSFTLKDIENLVDKLNKSAENLKEEGRKGQWFITLQEAKEMPLDVIKGWSEYYNIYCGLETKKILTQRFNDTPNNV